MLVVINIISVYHSVLLIVEASAFCAFINTLTALNNGWGERDPAQWCPGSSRTGSAFSEQGGGGVCFESNGIESNVRSGEG